MLKKIVLKKILIIIILFSLINTNLFSKITLNQAKKAKQIFRLIEAEIPLKTKTIITQSELNSYFHFYRKSVFSSEVKFIRIKLFENFLKLRLIYKFKENSSNKLSSFFDNTILEIIGELKIINIKKGCFKIDFKKLYINNTPINKELIKMFVNFLGKEYMEYLNGFCPRYKIKSITVKKGKIVIE